MKVNIITGGGSGIGFEVAKRMKSEKVIIAGINEEKLKKASSLINE